MWTVIFILGVIFVLVKSLREGVYAAMAGAYVYYCIPMREFFVPTAPYQPAFWALGALLSFRYGSMLSKWSTTELIDVSKNAALNAIAAVRGSMEQLLFNSAASRSPDAGLQRRFEAQVERPALEYLETAAPVVLKDRVVRAVKTAIERTFKFGSNESQKIVSSLPDATEAQLRSSLRQRVAPEIERVMDEQLDEALKKELGDWEELDEDEHVQELGVDQMGNIPKPKSPIMATLTNSGFWMFVGFTLMTIIGAQLSVHRPGMAKVKVETCILLFIPVIGILFAVRTDKHFKLFTWAWMFGVWQLSAQAARKWVTYGGRIDDVGGQGGEANFLGAIIVMVAPIAFSMLMTEKTANLRRVGYLAAAGYLLGILACGSRGAMCAFVGQMGYWLLHTGKKVKAYALALVAVACFLAVAPPEFMARMATIIEPKGSGFTKPKVEESKHERQLLWKLAVDVFKENPALGVGPQQYTHYSAVRLPQLVGAYSGKPGLMTHNSWLQILSEYGLVGSFFYIGGYFWSMLCFRRARKKLLPYKDYQWFGAYCLGFEAGGLGAALAMVFSSFQWLDFVFWYLVFGPLAYMIAVETKERLDWLTPVRPDSNTEGDSAAA